MNHQFFRIITTQNSSSPQKLTLYLLVSGIFLSALVMRSPLAGIGPLAEFIRQAMELSHSSIGLLTTLPLLCFAGLSGFILIPANRWGLKSTIATALFGLTLGLIIRSIPIVTTLFTGTLLIGISIAILNVLLPALVKRDFSHKSGFITSIYSSGMGLGATLGAGISVPLANLYGWTFSLGSWAILSFLALLVWIPQLKKITRTSAPIHLFESFKTVGSAPLAWKIAFFLGLQSFTFYVILAWLPDLLISRNVSSENAGWMLSIAQATGILGSMFIPIFAARFNDQRFIVIIITSVQVIGILGLLFASTDYVWLWVSLIGVALGSSFGLALLFMVLRAKNTLIATALSGFTQAVGYTIAGFGPFLIGLLHDFTHNWTTPFYSLLVLVIFQLYAGIGAGKPEIIGENLT